MSYIVVGASSKIGQHLAAAIAERGDDVVAVSSDRRDLDALVSDISIRSSARIIPVVCDVAADPDWLDDVDAALGSLSPVEGILLPIGASLPADDGSLGPEDVERLIRIDLTSVIAAVTRFMPAIVRSRGVVVAFSSVAASRGRGTNIVYSAAKRGLESFMESMRYRFGSDVRVQLYVLGFMESGTRSSAMLPRGDPRALAVRVVSRLDRDVGRVYYPRWWRYVVVALQWLPWPIFRRLRI